MSARVPRVSVCLATYNQAPYIEDSVLGVLGQGTDAEIELLVGNDASSDGTGAVLDALAARFPGRMTVFHREQNLGPGGNYQDLVRRATGDFIAHLDGDDAWLPGKLRAQLAFLAEHPQCPAVFSNGIAVATSGALLGPFSNSHPALMDLGYLCARGNYLMHSSMLYRAAWKDDFLGLEMPLIDYGIHLAMARRGPLGYVDQPLALYRVATATSLVRTSFPWVQAQLWRVLRQALPQLPPAQRRGATAHFVAAALLARAGGQQVRVWPLVKEAAVEAGCSAPRLLVAAMPHALALAIHGRLRKLLRGTGAGARMAEHYRA